MHIFFKGITVLVAAAFSLDSWTGETAGATRDVYLTGIDRVFPRPHSFALGEGRFSLAGTYSVSATGSVSPPGGDSARLNRAIRRFGHHLTLMTGVSLAREEPMVPVSTSGEPADINIRITGASGNYPSVETDEHYRLRIDKQGIEIKAASIYGAIYGLRSLLQLATGNGDSVVWPATSIDDRPRFIWRGLLQDVVRNWMPMDVIKRQLDAMAAVKMNVFHWHLTDDQSFRVESINYRYLHQLGSDGNYYTQDQIREIVEYAADRAIRVVPEFDLPGHSRSWQIAYPQLSSVPGKEYHLIKHDKFFADPIDPTREENYELLAGIIGEMSSLFPDRYFHLGGDEVDYSAWKDNKSIRQFMRDNDIDTPRDLQAYFIRRYHGIVTQLGKTAVAWDDIAHPTIPGDTVLTAWSTWQLSKDAAKFPIVLSRGYYLDSIQTAYYHHQRDPLDIAIDGVEMQILGGEVSSWAETINQHTVDMRNWPRTAAAAERFWSPKEIVDNTSAVAFYARLALVSDQLGVLGLKHRSHSPGAIAVLAQNGDAEALQILASVLEPTRYHNLYEWKRLLAYFTRLGWFYDSPEDFNPVQRLLENIPPESTTARFFNHRVDLYLAGKLTPEDIRSLRAQLIRWRDNEPRLRATIAASAILKADGIDEISQELAHLARAGLDALAVLESGEIPADRAWETHRDTIDRLAFEHFTGDEMEFLMNRMFKPRPLRLHNLPIQRGVARLVVAAENAVANAAPLYPFKAVCSLAVIEHFCQN